MTKEVSENQSKVEKFVELLEKMPGLYHMSDFFVFFKNTEDLLTQIDPTIMPTFVSELKKYLSQYKNGDILKKVHDLQCDKLRMVEFEEEYIFGGSVSLEDQQIMHFTQLLFCQAANIYMETVFELDLRYFKTVEMNSEAIRNKVLSVERVLYPLMITIQKACYIDMKDYSSNKLKKCLQVLESVTLTKEHAPDKLNRTVSAYSFLAFAICICYSLYEEKIINVKHLKRFNTLRDNLLKRSYHLSFDKGRQNVADFTAFINFAKESISFR